MRKGILPPAALLLWVFMLPLAACGRQAPITAPLRSSSTSAVPGTRLPFDRPIRAGYFYGYMSPSHLDSLAAAGFNRAIVKIIPNPLDARGTAELRAWVARGRRVPVDVTPAWTLQSASRLAALPGARRYTWGSGTVEAGVGCPLDIRFWRTALLDRALELTQTAPGIRRLALDLEIYNGSLPHYRDPCTCAECLNEFALATGAVPADAAAFAGGITRQAAPPAMLAAFEEARLTQMLTGLAFEYARSHRGVELGVLDLDRDSFVHRALARALTRARVPIVDYTERTYTNGAAPATQARAALDAIGVSAPVVGGLWLKQFPPAALPDAVDAMLDHADGWFAFTTFSLWVEPSELVGPYALQGTQAEYWSALRRANR